MRTFLAIEIDDDARARLAGFQQRLARCGAKVKWVEPKNIHVTLCFLGELTDQAVRQVCDLAAETAGGVERFDFAIRPPVCVPAGGRQVRMIWSDVEDPTGRMKLLQAGLEDALADIAEHHEQRQFRPHLTLGRVKAPAGSERLRQAAVELAGQDMPPQQATEVVVFASELTREGPIYTPLARCPLGGSA